MRGDGGAEDETCALLANRSESHLGCYGANICGGGLAMGCQIRATARVAAYHAADLLCRV